MLDRLRARLAAWIAPAVPAPPSTDNRVRAVGDGGTAVQAGTVDGGLDASQHTHRHDVHGGLHHTQTGGIGHIHGAAGTVIGTASGPLHLGSGATVTSIQSSRESQ